MKLPLYTSNDKLCERFKTELLYLIGLKENQEVEQGNSGKINLSRMPARNRQQGSLLELAVAQLGSKDNFCDLPEFKGSGTTQPDRFYYVALRLCITWIERFLFLKLLEAQLHKQPDKKDDWSILKLEKVGDFEAVNRLFLQLDSTKPAEPVDKINKLFNNLPILNTTLFKPTALEKQTYHIGKLANNISLPLFTNTVISAEQVLQVNASFFTLSYLLNFLNAYNFNVENRENSIIPHAANHMTEDSTPSSPVCYMNSPELREEFIIPTPQPLLNMSILNQYLDILLFDCFGAYTMEKVKTD